jgi:hypothetical protein
MNNILRIVCPTSERSSATLSYHAAPSQPSPEPLFDVPEPRHRLLRPAPPVHHWISFRPCELQPVYFECIRPSQKLSPRQVRPTVLRLHVSLISSHFNSHENDLQILSTTSVAAVIISVVLRSTTHPTRMRLHINEQLVRQVVLVVVAEEGRLLRFMHLSHTAVSNVSRRNERHWMTYPAPRAVLVFPVISIVRRLAIRRVQRRRVKANSARARSIALVDAH